MVDGFKALGDAVVGLGEFGLPDELGCGLHAESHHVEGVGAAHGDT